MNKRQNKGISLITLVITIVVIVILVGAIVLSISNNNPINQASDAVVRQDLTAMLEDFNTIYVTELGNNKGSFELIDSVKFENVVPDKYKTDMYADKYGIHYKGTDEKIIEIIENINNDFIGIEGPFTNVEININFNEYVGLNLNKQKMSYMKMYIEFTEKSTGKTLVANIGKDGRIETNDANRNIFKDFEIIDSDPTSSVYKTITIKGKVKWTVGEVNGGFKANPISIKLRAPGFKPVNKELVDGTVIVADKNKDKSEYGYTGSIVYNTGTTSEFMVGDVNQDGKVEGDDKALLAGLFNMKVIDDAGNPVQDIIPGIKLEYTIGSDLNRDGYINNLDKEIVVAQVGK